MINLYDMYYAILDNYFTKVLKKNTCLKDYLYESPQAYTIPIKETRKRVLVIWLILKQDSPLTLKLLSNMIDTVLDAIKNKLFLKRLTGIEIILGFRLENQEVDKIVNVSLWPGNYKKWKQVKPVDMLKDKPYEGIQCGWYRDKKLFMVE